MKKVPIWFLLVIVIAAALLLTWLVISGTITRALDPAAQGLVDFFNNLLKGGVPKS